MANFDRRPRGRGSNRRNGRRHSGSRSSQVIKLNDQGRSFNHQRIRFNGNASKLFEKYNKLAAEALSIGDKILAESYFQHADHFSRMLPSQEEIKNINEENKDDEISSSEEDNNEVNLAKETNLNKLDDDDNTVVAKSSE
ncbi:MAG: DUF4167 domain-containing protein [Pelagibacteraceae bacterium]|jgi:hypothetical protein